MARNSVANYEIGRLEPTNAVLVSICREFNVNKHWLCEGEMFNEEAIGLDEYAHKNDLDDIEIEIIKIIMSISKEERKKVIEQMKKVFKQLDTENEIAITKNLSQNGIGSSKKILGHGMPPSGNNSILSESELS